MDNKDREIARDYFIANFWIIIKESLSEKLPPSATERDYLEKTYDIMYKKLMHIKTGMNK